MDILGRLLGQVALVAVFDFAIVGFPIFMERSDWNTQNHFFYIGYPGV